MKLDYLLLDKRIGQLVTPGLITGSGLKQSMKAVIVHTRNRNSRLNNREWIETSGSTRMDNSAPCNSRLNNREWIETTMTLSAVRSDAM
ncbi:protein of unknown function [Methylocaldum szegediense]|uniref:Uncharacterized protein n=1 Tax=Methylocaldum szegediense TaxID=73780 RepID=A0ABM9I950_9GAMM|nr:protein of unknown function [Methylocaldum szegediense]